MVFTAYTMEGQDRPVTFALNGGPGAASVFLNFGAIGPKHLEFGMEGDSPSDPAKLTDNPGTWLDFTDLVFIDPVGTGYSRSLVPADEAKKQFYTTDNDIHYLSRIIYDWLVANGRLSSRKYFVGESYGGYRGPRITHYLQTQLGVAMNGVVLVSPYLNPALDDNRRRLSGAVDADAAVDYGGASRARTQADAGSDGAGNCVHARRVCHRPAEGPIRSGGYAANRQARDRDDRSGRGVCAAGGRPAGAPAHICARFFAREARSAACTTRT